MDSVNRLGKKWYILLAGILALFLFFATYSVMALNTDKIHKGISVGDVDVSGLTKDQAISRLEGQRRDFNTRNLVVKCQEKTWEIPYSTFDAKYNIPEAVNKAYSVGRTGNIFRRLSDVAASRSGNKFDLVFSYNKQYLVDIITKIKNEVEIPRRNAKLVPGQSGATVLPHATGRKLDFNNALVLAESHVAKLTSAELNLPIIEDAPSVVDTQLKDMIDELGSFSTKFNAGDSSRTHNIKLASSRINGTVLKPGEVYSMDKTLRNRTVSNGYKLSKAYLDDEVVEEIGGGVCQVTTTLYGAVMHADLNVLERKPHTMMVDYVQPGFDATVSDKGIDFKFKNNYNMPIYLYSSVDGNKLNMKIFGKKQDAAQSVQLESEVTDIFYAEPEEVLIDLKLGSGARKVEVKSRNGYKASLYKSIYKNGVLVSRQLVSENVYRPRRGKILIGR